ncbi:MAG: PD-(D/E)XK nuclease family protein [Bacteroidales bacterium]
MSFIQETAKKIIESCGTDLRSVAIVVPGRRGGLFLKKELAMAAGKTILLPQIFSIEEYIFDQSGMRKMDETTMLTLLYTVYKKHAGQSAFPIDEFLPTGKTLLADFNDVDDYLLDPDEVFTYLMRVREIENWMPGEAETELQKRYLSFYQLLKPMYHLFTEKCHETGMCYQGKASRILSQQDTFSDFSRIVFAGLNAVTPSLEAHINKLLLSDQALLIWDTDSWYLDNPNHEAGHFMRLNRNSWPKTFGETPRFFENISKKIEFIGAPLGYSQVQSALTLLDTKYRDDISNTLLVLADEGLMMPLLSSLPEEWDDRVNISGGYPLRNTLLGQFVNAQLELISGTLNENGAVRTYRYEQLLEVVSNPLLRLLPDENQKREFSEVVDEISSGRLRYFRWCESDKDDTLLLKRFNVLIPGVVSPYESWDDVLSRLISLTSELFEKCREVDLEHEAAWLVQSMLKALSNTLKNYGDVSDVTIGSVVYFIRRHLQIAKIPLKGEPLKGIQILGMLETRSLDFKNVIIVGANEGFLPAGGQGDSFLPNDVRRELKLPLQYERDAVYAYHFWRLIQRAEEITLIYNTESDPLFGKEPSRFLAQIEHELKHVFPSIVVERRVLGISYDKQPQTSFNFVDVNKIQVVLNKIAESGLSFSRLYNFIACPHRFLLESIYNIQKWEDETGDIAINTMGSVFHDAIEHLTIPFLGKILVKQDFDTMSAAAETALHDAFQHLKVSHTSSGYNFLVKEVLSDTLLHWLHKMKQTLPGDYYVRAVEQLLKPQISLKDGRIVTLKGVADRVEFCNGIMRVMDFKTTNKRSRFNFDDGPDAGIYEQICHPENHYMTQVLFYSWLFSLTENVEAITGGVYPVLNSAGYNPDLLRSKDKELLVLKADQLIEIGGVFFDFIEQIFDPQQTFDPQPAVKTCQYCPYNGVICFANTFEITEDES